MTFKTNLQDFCERGGADPSEVQRVYSAVGTPGCWLGGGSIRRTLLGQPLDSDFDFFFKSEEALGFWQDSLPNTVVKVKETEHHIQYEGTLRGSDLKVILQAIRFKYYTSAEEVLDSFDYTITQVVYDGTYLHTTPEALWDMGRKKLVIHKVTYPVSTMRRMLKYTSQGFTACSGCMKTLFTETINSPDALSQMDITYVD